MITSREQLNLDFFSPKLWNASLWTEYFHHDLIDVKWFSLFWWVINVVLFPVGIWSFCNRKLASLCLFLFNFSPTVIFHLSKQEAAAAKVQEFPKRFYKRYRDDCLETFFCLLQKPLICLHFFVSSWNCCYYNFVNCSIFCVVFFSLFGTLFVHPPQIAMHF